MSLRGAEIMWLLGAGASVAAGVPSADGLMWLAVAVLAMATRRRLPIEAIQHRLGIVEIEMARPAVHEELDDRPRLRRKVRLPRL